MSADTSEQAVTLCEALASLLVRTGNRDQPTDIDRARFGPLIDQLGDGIPEDIRDQVLILRELFRPFETDPGLVWDDYIEGVDSDTRAEGVAAIPRVNAWMFRNCREQIAVALGGRPGSGDPPRPRPPSGTFTPVDSIEDW